MSGDGEVRRRLAVAAMQERDALRVDVAALRGQLAEIARRYWTLRRAETAPAAAPCADLPPVATLRASLEALLPPPPHPPRETEVHPHA